MKHLYRLTAIVLFGSATVIAQQVAQPDRSSNRERDRREIERLEAEWNTINEISDADGKDRLLAEDSYHVGPSGRLYNKTQDVEATRLSHERKQAASSTTKFQITGMKIRLYKNVAVVTATGWSVTTLNGQTRRGNSFRAIHVWEKSDGRWQMVVDQVTGVAN